MTDGTSGGLISPAAGIEETPGAPSRLRLVERVLGASEGARSLSFALGVTLVFLIVLFGLHGNYYDSMFVFATTFAIVVVGMVLQVGHSHQLAFHQSVFMMAGAYGVAILTAKEHYPVWLAMIVVVVGCSVAGGLLGAYITRVPGFALALATLFFSVIVVGAVEYNSYLGAQTGLGPIPFVVNGSSYVQSLEYSGAVGVALLGISVYIVSRVMNSGVGLELTLLATNERMAEGIGVFAARRKLELFVLGSAFAALGGAVFATTQQFVTPSTFSQTAEITFLVMLFLGGRASLLGSLCGAVGIEYFSGTSNFVADNQGIIEGVLITAVLLYAPSGFIGLLRVLGNAIWSRLARHVGLAAPGAAPVPPLPAPRAPSRRPEEAGSLECRELTKRFGGLVAVDAVSFTISGAGIYAICGPNGAGKTTLFELIAGGLKADHGEVLIGGVDATHLLAHRRAQLGMARTLQTVRLMNTRTALDNVAVAALESHQTFMTGAVLKSGLREARSRAGEELRHLGIEHLANRRPGELTLEAQRMVEFARAMVARPRLVLLDEPASGLSVEQRERLSATLQELATDTTVVLVEHDLQLVSRIAKEIFVLIDGKLVFNGGPEEFMASEVVRTELMGLVEDEKILEA